VRGEELTPVTGRRARAGVLGIALAACSAALLALGTIGAGGAPAQQPATADSTVAGVVSLVQPTPARVHDIAWDGYSLLLDGERERIWSAEFHYWRLPSTSLWRDVLQKYRAAGFNAISVYFHWGYHSPAPGVYDFGGVRDVDLLLDIAQEEGLYVIARPGPYINAETTRGGFPGWLTTVDGVARTDAPDYTAAADEWLTEIDAILARRQYTDGTGPVVLYQIENELARTDAATQRAMEHLAAKVRSDGIDVPLFHNDVGNNGLWVPAFRQDGTPTAVVPDTLRTSAVDLYAFDSYAAGACEAPDVVGDLRAAPNLGLHGVGGRMGGSTASPETPGFLAETGGGWFDYWGSPGLFDCTAQRQGLGHQRVFYGTNIVNGLTLHNIYMVFGGTSWGWLPSPVVYTSYDYGAAITEGRQARDKLGGLKQLGYLLDAVPQLRELDAGAPVAASSAEVTVLHDVAPATGTHVYLATHEPSSSVADTAFTFPVETDDGDYLVPQSGTLRLAGQDAKLLLAAYDLERQRLVYSTSQLTTHLRHGEGTDGRDVALLHGRAGEDGETVLRYASEPTVTVLAGEATATWDAARGDLRLDYPHDGLTEVLLRGGGRAPLLLLIADDATAAGFWREDTDAGAVLVAGPELVRGADATVVAAGGARLDLTGDTATETELRVWADDDVVEVTWNGTPVAVGPAPVAVGPADASDGAGSWPGGSLVAVDRLPGPDAVDLPDLSTAVWRVAPGSPESEPGFDDSDWAVVGTDAVGRPVLDADEHGFHQGDVWYRGRFVGGLDSVTLTYGGGGAGLLQAWVDGVYLGQDVVPSGQPTPETTSAVTFEMPPGLGAGEHVLSVMVRNNGHNQDIPADDMFKEPRGLVSVDLTGVLVPRVAWRVQGTAGGEQILDPVRGVMNAGGSFGERHGFHLPGYPDADWSTGSVPAGGSDVAPGTTWYRTTLDLDLPADHDVSLGLTIGDPSVPAGDARYRALVFVNGWNVGQYVADVGPQHTFVLPNGILDPRGANTLAIAVTSDGGAGNGLEEVELTTLGVVRGGVPVTPEAAPSWSADVYGTVDAGRP